MISDESTPGPGPSPETGEVPLVLAAHGTRAPEGQEHCNALARRVAALLPTTYVGMGFVELVDPGIDEAVATALRADGEARADGPRAVVVPLMMNTGGHVRVDIPEAVDKGREGQPIAYARPLAPDARLRALLRRRIVEAMGEWDAEGTSVVLVGRGAVVADANAEHYRLARLIWEEMGAEQVLPAFIQVNHPSVPEALSAAVAAGAARIVVAPNFLFPGRLQTWLGDQTEAWAQGHPGVDVRVAGVLGDSDELAAVVVDRYLEQLGVDGAGEGSGLYLAGLDLRGADVLVVGAGYFAENHIPALLEAGASVRVVAANAGNQVARWARTGRLKFTQRGFEDSDIGQVRLVAALTNDPEVNARVCSLARLRGIFCVRADRPGQGTAVVPQVEQAGGITVGVLGQGDPGRSARVRDELLRALQG
ncbi:hypothetical protein GCM10009785_07380 [Brooklawnia cerclae]|uniref:precorrin-2 dehydrogenase n=1 Tax=Brooklawnia cerclae TaxID=349934 RepID=A0ABX0SNG0_9ACTN|nr:CbiX/SirB N-terminal domain-containing protein [Brooklawnia cerclae]NIH58316.1 sirohydrochlorin cobaltochelatase [Brooklawnia cerclae]